MQKLRHKTVVKTSLLFQKFQGLAGVDSASVKFRLIFLFRIFVVLLQLRSNSQEGRPIDCAGVQIKKTATLLGNKLTLAPKNIKKRFSHYCTKSLSTFTTALLRCSHLPEGCPQ